MEVYDALARARGAGERVVLVTVVAVQGEAPSRAGAKVVVGDAGIVAGTLGCSEYDNEGVALAAEALSSGQPLRREVTAPSPEPRGIELFAEVFEPEPAVLVMGATPVGRALAELARVVGRRAVLVSRGGDTAVGRGVEVKADEPERYLLNAPPGRSDALVVSDHDAPWVDAVLRIALASDAFFVGMLGSRRHAPSAVRRLRDGGTPEAHLARLHSPCGLDIGSQTPEEIALSILAEIIATERDGPGGSMGIGWATP